jgi:hypothetical protein
MIPANVSRRAILKGAGVALSLPWLETFAPRTAKAATAGARRYILMNFPNGTTDAFWLPAAPGAGNAWSITPILEPLLPVKAKMLVLLGVGNYSAYGNVHAEPSHGTNYGPAYHCWDSRVKGTYMGTAGISVDQVIANQVGGATMIPSLQVGLSTLDSYCDGSPCAHSRSVSWSGSNAPLYKIVNPQAVFDRLVAGGVPKATTTGTTTTTGGTMPPNTNMPDPKLAQMRAMKKSVLDAVIDSASTLQPKLSTSDKTRVDQFLTSVRDLEKLVAAPAMQVGTGMPPGMVGGPILPVTGCAAPPRPPEAYADMNTPPDYSRETHANLMIQLVTMAFACDITRVVTFALDDARSDYVYSHVPMRNFNMPTSGKMTPPYTLSTQGNGTCAGYHGLQHAGNTNDGFATITWWNALKASQLAQALDGLAEPGGGTVLDNSVIHFMAGMHGGNHDGLNLPTVLIGGLGGLLKQNAYMDLHTSAMADAPGTGVRLANLHRTFMQSGFGAAAAAIAAFGSPGAHTGIIPDILA